jgi:hypothetical protein
LQDVEAFVERYQWYCTNIGEPKPDEIVNFDETRLTYGKDGKLRISAATFDRVNVQDVRLQSAGSLNTFVAADGSRLLDAMCIKGQEVDGLEDAVRVDNIALPLEEAREARGSVKLLYVFNKSGFFDMANLEAILDAVVDEWCLRHGAVGGAVGASGEVCVKRLHLFCDNLASHRTESIVLKMLARNVMMWFLPANTSHFDQPLDAEPFARFKFTLTSMISTLNFAAILSGTSQESVVLYAAHKCLSVLTSDVIKRGFASTHLAPFDREAFLATARMHTGQHIKAAKMEIAGHMAINALELLLGDNGVVADATRRTNQLNAEQTPITGVVSTKTAYNGAEMLLITRNNEAFNKFSADQKEHTKTVKQAQAKHKKELQQASKVCRVAGCDRTHTARSKGWFVSQCGDFMICNEHAPNYDQLQLVNELEAHKAKCAVAQESALAKAEAAARAAALDCRADGTQLCAKCALECDGATDEVQCSKCELWVHAKCASGSAAAAGVDGAKYYCSSTCTVAEGLKSPPRKLKSGVAVVSPVLAAAPTQPVSGVMDRKWFRNAPKVASKAIKIRGLGLAPSAASLVADREWAKRMMPPPQSAAAAGAVVDVAGGAAAVNAVDVHVGVELDAAERAAQAAQAVAAARALAPARSLPHRAPAAQPRVARRRIARARADDSDDDDDDDGDARDAREDDTSESSAVVAELQRALEQSSESDVDDVLDDVRAVAAVRVVRAAVVVRADAEVRAAVKGRADAPRNRSSAPRKRAAPPASSPLQPPPPAKRVPASAPPNERVRSTRNTSSVSINVSVNVSLSRMFRDLTEKAKENAS